MTNQSPIQDSGELGTLLSPRARVTLEELERMPASLKPAEAIAWTRLARGSFYRWLATSGLACHLGGSIRIPTRRFMVAIGVLDDEA